MNIYIVKINGCEIWLWFFFLDFVSFKASTIVNPIDKGERCSWGHWENVIWRADLLYIGLHGNLVAYMGSCERVEFTLLYGNNDMSKRSIDAQMSSSKSDSTNTLLSLGFNLTVAIKGIWTMDVLDLFVKMIVKACNWDWERPITLNEPNPKIHMNLTLII